jgi:hypothetical protein
MGRKERNNALTKFNHDCDDVFYSVLTIPTIVSDSLATSASSPRSFFNTGDSLQGFGKTPSKEMNSNYCGNQF